MTNDTVKSTCEVLTWLRTPKCRQTLIFPHTKSRLRTFGTETTPDLWADHSTLTTLMSICSVSSHGASTQSDTCTHGRLSSTRAQESMMRTLSTSLSKSCVCVTTMASMSSWTPTRTCGRDTLEEVVPQCGLCMLQA